jgi:hypothetical protein
VVSVDPPAAFPGDTVVVSGRNFAADAKVSVYLGGATGTPLQVGFATARGDLVSSLRLTVPNDVGTKILTVVDDRSQFPVTLVLTIQPPPTF